jgi:hypothetical protein
MRFKALGLAGFAAQAYLSGVNMYENPTASNITHQSFNIGMGVVGFMGPVGFGVSAAYVIVDETIGWGAVLSAYPPGSLIY